MQIHVAGENALMIYFADQVSDAVSDRIQQMAQALPGMLGESLIDLVPSYASVMVLFNPFLTDHLAVRKAIRSVADQLEAQQSRDGKLVELPVYYSAESGPDLGLLAERSGLSVDEVVEIHQRQEYRVYAIGFAPGFAYLGQVDERIAAPRLPTPRLKVPRGAVAIADRQTAVYPAESPGGWNLIGLCPTPMFDPTGEPIMPVTAGDRVRFKAIDLATFNALGGELPEGLLEEQAP